MPADIKLLSTHLCSNTVKHNHRKPPPKQVVLVQHRTQSKHSPATPTQPHKANHTVLVPANPLHPFTSFRNNKNHAALTLLPGWRLCLSRQKLQRLQLLRSPGKQCLLQYPSTYCIAFQRSESGCSPRAHMARSAGGLSIQHNSAPKSLHVKGNCLCSELGVSGCRGCSPYPLPLVDAK